MSMTVAELIAELQQLPQDSIVVMSTDGEGNSFSPYGGYSDQLLYEADSSWSGEIHDPEEWAEEQEECCDEGEEIPPCPGVPCVILWPVN